MEDNQNIEKFFKDKMNQPVRPEAWNTPDDSVWEGISDELDKDKRPVKRMPWSPLIFLFLLSALLISGYFHYLQKETIHQLRQEIALCDDAAKSEQDTDETYNSGKQIAKTGNFMPGKANDKDVIVKDAQNRNAVHQNTDFSRPSPLQNKDIEHVLDEGPLAGIQNPELAEQPGNVPLYQPAKHAIANLPVLLGDIIQLQNKPDIFTMNKPVPRKKKYASMSGLSMGSFYWIDRQKGSILHPLSELLVEEKTFMSPVAGLQFNRQISGKWSFNVGIEFYNRTQRSLYAIQQPYSKDTEIDAGNGFENHFQHSLPTGLGNINTYLVLSRSRDSQLSDNEIISLDFEMKNRAALLSVPVGLSYYFQEFGKGPFITSGIRTEVVINNRISEMHLKSHHPLVQDNHMNVEYNNLQMNKLNMSLTLGAGYQIPVWRDYHLTCLIQYGQALNPIFRSENYAHDIHSLQGQLIFSKKW